MRIMQNEMIDRGYLQVNVTDNENIPIENVNISGKITISSIQDKINRLEYNNEDLANTIENRTINNCVVNFVVEDLR